MCNGMLKVGVEEPERAHLVCVILLQRIVERISMAHLWDGILQERMAALQKMIRTYCSQFQLLYGTQQCIHKFVGFACRSRTKPTNSKVDFAAAPCPCQVDLAWWKRRPRK